MSVFCSIVSAITIFGNVLVLLAIILKSNLRKVRSNTFIASLGKFIEIILTIAISRLFLTALTDLLVGVLVMPYSIQYHVYHNHWVSSVFMCYFWTFADLISSTASIWSLVAIAIDRWMVSVEPTVEKKFSRVKFIYVLAIKCRCFVFMYKCKKKKNNN